MFRVDRPCNILRRRYLRWPSRKGVGHVQLLYGRGHVLIPLAVCGAMRTSRIAEFECTIESPWPWQQQSAPTMKAVLVPTQCPYR